MLLQYGIPFQEIAFYDLVRVYFKSSYSIYLGTISCIYNSFEQIR